MANICNQVCILDTRKTKIRKTDAKYSGINFDFIFKNTTFLGFLLLYHNRSRGTHFSIFRHARPKDKYKKLHTLLHYF